MGCAIKHGIHIFKSLEKGTRLCKPCYVTKREFPFISGALDGGGGGGPQCRLSILRNDNVAYHCCLFSTCHMKK